MRGTQVVGAYSNQDRTLPCSSPSANLVGIWKGDRNKSCHPAAFFFSCALIGGIMEENGKGQSFFERIRLRVFGKPRDIHDNPLFHKLSLIPVPAWIGLGADGLSSSSYGSEEALRALGPHNSLFKLLSLVTISGTPRALR